MPEPQRQTLARRALAVALALGVLADAVLRVEWGLGFTLLVVAIAAGAAGLVAWRDGRLRGEVAVWTATAVLFAAMFSWRDSEQLRVFDAAAAAVALGLARVAAIGEPARGAFAASVRDALVAVVRFAFDLLTGLPRLVLRDAAPWGSNAARTRLTRVPVTIALTALVLLVFGALLAGADPVFASWVDILRWDWRRILSHLALAGVATWLIAGGFRGGLLPWERTPTPPRQTGLSAGFLEITSVLGALAALFAIFLVSQFAWLVGGAEYVLSTTGLTFAEFARRGFFQLILVGLLLLPVLLAFGALIRADDPRARRAYTVLASVLLALLAVITVSAGAKLRLYVSFYGLSTARIYAAAAIFWLLVVFGLFAATVLRGRGRGFAAGAIVAGFAILLALHVINPDAAVARYNLTHELPRETRPEGTDFGYLAQLSADAMPIVVPAIATRPPSQGQPACHAAWITARWVDGRQRDWRSWNAGKARAQAVARRHSDQLRELGC